jgi:hypothetical protein
VAYAVPPLAGLDTEKQKAHPYTTKGGAPAKATAKSRGILRCAQDDAQKQKHSDKKTTAKTKAKRTGEKLTAKAKTS